MASETTTTDPRIGEIRKNPKDDRGIHVYEVYTVDGWVCPSDQDTAKVNYDNQDFNQTIASSQADAGLEPVGGTTLDGGSVYVGVCAYGTLPCPVYLPTKVPVIVLTLGSCASSQNSTIT